VCGFPLPKSIYVRLEADARPGSMKTAVEPEARLVAEHHESATCEGLFLIAGNVLRSQVAGVVPVPVEI
jgi:hypothetical protein